MATPVQELRILDDVRPIVRHHHERLDGTGYPDGLEGDAIPLLARMMSIVDVYDAVTSTRPYRDALIPDAAFRELRQETANGWKDTEHVEAFISLVLENGPASASTEPLARPVQRWRK